ncbi:hypothetical protein HUJ04_003009 [Dendroctonus ponderosae]|nr:hypothetical protein HUJ04_003009 [Dendroctonus ponderosae]
MFCMTTFFKKSKQRKWMWRSPNGHGRKLLGTGDEIHGSKTVNREIGYHISRLEKYDKSLEYFDKAVKENPDDRRTLIGRSTARAKAAQYGGAMEDIGHVLSIDPDDLTAWSVSTRNMYLCAEFEEGKLKFNYSTHRF